MPKYSQHGTQSKQAIDVLASALASPRRVAIFDRLCVAPATTSELAAETGTALPTMQQHLERLRHAGLVSSSKLGRTVTHTAELEPLAELEEWIATRRSFWTSQLDSLANALENEHDC